METVERIRSLMNELELSTNDRKVVAPALAKAEKSGEHAVAIELPNGKIVTAARWLLTALCRRRAQFGQGNGGNKGRNAAYVSRRA